jgi:hypothetical protein
MIHEGQHAVLPLMPIGAVSGKKAHYLVWQRPSEETEPDVPLITASHSERSLLCWLLKCGRHGMAQF